MLCQIRHFKYHRPRHTDVVKYHDNASDLPSTIVYRCGGIFDGGFHAVAPTQDAVGSKRYAFVVPNRQSHRIWRRFAGRAIDGSEAVLKRMAFRLTLRPT